MNDRTLREMNALSHHVELMRLVEAVRRVGWPRRAGRQAARLDLRLAAWLGGRMVRWGADLARYGGPGAMRRGGSAIAVGAAAAARSSGCAPAGAGPVGAARGG